MKTLLKDGGAVGGATTNMRRGASPGIGLV